MDRKPPEASSLQGCWECDASHGPELDVIALTPSQLPGVGLRVWGKWALKRVKMTYVGHYQKHMLESDPMREEWMESSLSISPGSPPQCADGPGL